MLSPADAALVQRDPALPGLATLLDPAAFAALLQSSCQAVTIHQAVATYVRYKPATNCLVSYRVTTDVGHSTVYGLALPSDESAKLNKAAQRYAQPGLLGIGVVVHPEVSLILYAYPNDRRLTALWRLADAPRRKKLLQALAPTQPALWNGTLTPLRYKPERRCVLRLAGKKNQALLRFYTADEFALAAANHRAFSPDAAFCTPPVLGVAPDDQALLLAWLPGEPLENHLSTPARFTAALPAVGRALARLHAQRPYLPFHCRATDEITAVQSAATALSQLTPELGARATRLAAVLAEKLAATPRVVTPIHGDFSADQVLLPAPQADPANNSVPVAFLDLDRASYGDPAADLGSFAANLYQRALVSPLTAGQISGAMAALVAGYQATVAPLVVASSIQLHTAARLLRLTPEPFRHRWSPDWPNYITMLLQQAEEIAAHA